MSDQTPEAAIEASEPSMEDILASIRKIIADDDAPESPESIAFENEGLDNETDNIGNISNLVTHEDTALQDINLLTKDKTIDPGIEHFVPNQGNLGQDNIDASVSDLERTREDSLAPDDMMNDLMTEMSLADNTHGNDGIVDLELGTVLEPHIDNALSPIPKAVIGTPIETAVFEDDFEDISETVDLEIPAPDPNESLAELIEQSVSDEAEPVASSDISEDITDLDAELSALLETTLALDADTVNVEGDVEDTDELVHFDDVNLADLDLTDDTSLDLDLSMMLNDDIDSDASDNSIAAQNAAPEAETLQQDSGDTPDDGLEALLEEIQAVSSDEEPMQSDEMATLDDFISDDIALDDVLLDTVLPNDTNSDEDADLLLVKSLMADLTDYNTDVDDGSAEFEPGVATEDTTEEADISSDFDMDDLTQLDGEILELESISEISDDERLSDIPDVIEADEADILDEILEMTLDDELKSETRLDIVNVDDVAALELENIIENAALDASDVEMPESKIPESDVPDMSVLNAAPAGMSLSDIAAAAKADADVGIVDENIGLSAVLAGVGAASLGVGGAAIAARLDTTDEDNVEQRLSNLLDEVNADIPEDEIFDLESFVMNDETDDISEVLEIPSSEQATTAPESFNELEPIEETTDMPRAAARNTDVIMDDVTETATASVFAQLNQVVEEKAIVAERGDRVGDLVMEALRPMLKDWLDANLKGIVERAVAKEVKRISSGK